MSDVEGRAPRLRIRLWVWLALFTAAVAILPPSTVGFFAMRIAADEAIAKQEEVLVREAVAHASYVGTWVYAQEQALEGQMNLFNIGSLETGFQQGFLRSVFVAVPAAVTVALVDPEGAPVLEPVYLDFAPEDGPLVGRQLGSSVRARGLLGRLPQPTTRPGSLIGPVYRPPGAREAVVPVGVVGPYDSRLTLGAELSLFDVADVLRARSSDRLGIVLVDEVGEAILGGEHPLVQANWPLDAADDSAVRVAWSAVDGTTWRLAVVESSSVAAATSERIRGQMGWILFVVALLAVLAGVGVARGVGSRIRPLRDGALDVARGEYGRHVVPRGTDEIRELAEAFNLMSTSLKVSRDELEDRKAQIESFNVELQQRVEERTAELQEAQRELVRSGQLAAVAEVGAGLAHELNNPLAGILGLAQVLKARGGPDTGLFAQMEEQAERCRVVVETMLRYTSGEVDREPVDVIPVSRVLGEAVDLVAGAFRQRGVVLSLREPEGDLQVRVDAVEMARILAQVASVLRSGLPGGSHVVLSAHADDGDLCVSFEPSESVAVGERRDDFMASGLSLWVARQAISGLGGSLDVPTGEGPWMVRLPGALL